MRPVAIALLALVALPGLPAGVALNECVAPCQTVAVPASQAGGARTFFVYLQAVACQPASCGPKPPGAAVIGLVYEDTNGDAGLQRFASFTTPPDQVRFL